MQTQDTSAVEDPALVRAKKHVKHVRDFWYHFMVYVLVNAMLVVVDRGTGPNDGFMGLDWAYWLIIFWGFGIAGHAISVFFDDYRVRKTYAQERRWDV